jgi:hypothetical protein
LHSNDARREDSNDGVKMHYEVVQGCLVNWIRQKCKMLVNSRSSVRCKNSGVGEPYILPMSKKQVRCRNRH